MALEAEQDFLDRLLTCPLYVIFAHGGTQYSVSDEGEHYVKTTQVPDNLLVNRISVPGEILIAESVLLRWFLGRNESRINTMIPLFAVHSISDLYGQNSVYWNREDIPFRKQRQQDPVTGQTKIVDTIGKRNIEAFMKFGVFQGSESQFEHLHRVKGGDTTVDLSYNTSDYFAARHSLRLGLYKFMPDGRIEFNPVASNFSLSDVFYIINHDTSEPALVCSISCAAWDYKTPTDEGTLFPDVLNYPSTGLLTRKLIRDSEMLYAENEAEYHTLPLITRDSPIFRVLKDKCGPIIMPNLIFHFGGKPFDPEQNSATGILNKVSSRIFENAIAGQTFNYNLLNKPPPILKKTRVSKRMHGTAAAAAGGGGGNQNGGYYKVRKTRRRRN